MYKFTHVPCGHTLPQNNVHAVSVSIPTMGDVISYEEGENETIKIGYPRFVLHPYLKKLALFLEDKYKVKNTKEVVLVSSKRFAKLICQKYSIKEELGFDEKFGVILAQKNTDELQKILTYIQHVGCNLSSRFAEDFLYERGLIESLHVEELEETSKAKDVVLSTLGEAYNQPKENISLCTSGMNAVYATLKGLEDINPIKDIIIQLGWLYIDTMNIVKNHSVNSKVFYDVKRLDLIEEYLKTNYKKVSAIVTEVPSNPLILTADLEYLRALCDKYDVFLVIDSTFAMAYNIDLKPYADIMIESLTKFACGNADVLMGCFIINENSKLSEQKEKFIRHEDAPFIKDVRRLAYEIQNYESRVTKINYNCKKLIEYLNTKDFIAKIYSSLDERNYIKLMRNQDAVGGVISLTFRKPIELIYDKLNFAKGPSLGTEFTLLMPYVYLAHYDLITSKEGRKILKQNEIPIDLVRFSVGCEDIKDIIGEFERVSYMLGE